MSVFLALLGLAMMVGGLAAIYSGSLFVGIERGWTMVVAGTVAFSAGAILLGLAAALRRLKRIERATKRLAGAFAFQPSSAQTEVLASTLDLAGASVPTGQPRTAAADSAPETITGPAPLEPAESQADQTGPDGADAPPDKVVGTYQAGGNSYVMYADGSIRADTPSGEHRFATMDEFKAFMLTGTLRARAPDEQQKISPPAGSAQVSESPTAFSAKA